MYGDQSCNGKSNISIFDYIRETKPDHIYYNKINDGILGLFSKLQSFEMPGKNRNLLELIRLNGEFNLIRENIHDSTQDIVHRKDYICKLIPYEFISLGLNECIKRYNNQPINVPNTATVMVEFTRRGYGRSTVL